MAVELPKLPYALDALAPHISKQTLEFHYGKHHQAYVTNLNGLIKDTDMDAMDLEQIIMASAGNAGKQGIFNNAAQVWNHTFYWNSMKPNGGGEPTGALKDLIINTFGSVDEMKTQFKQAGATQFGSGWAWLVLTRDGKLAIRKTPNAELPQTGGETPLLTMDVWEHAYYLDYQNKRPDYMDIFLNKLVNWQFAAENLEAALKKKAA